MIFVLQNSFDSKEKEFAYAEAKECVKAARNCLATELAALVSFLNEDLKSFIEKKTPHESLFY